MKLTPVTPLRTEICVLVGDDGSRTFESPVFPPSERGERLRQARMEQGASLGRIATVLGISITYLYGLERGRLTTDDAGWDEIFAALNGKGGDHDAAYGPDGFDPEGGTA